MKSECRYQHKLSVFPDQGLSDELYLHINQCEICRKTLNQFKSAEDLFFKYQRPEIESALLSDYYANLSNQLETKVKPVKKAKLFRLPVGKAIIYAALLIAGIYIGKILYHDTGPQPGNPVIGRTIFQAPVSVSELDYLGYYLDASEIVLMDILNDQKESLYVIEPEVAQKLLIKTFVIHEIALQLNEPKVLSFLNKMEILLHELANSRPEENVNWNKMIYPLIHDSNLLEEVRELQKYIKNSRKLFES